MYWWYDRELEYQSKLESGDKLHEKSGNPRSHAIRYTQGTPTEYNSKRTKRKAKAHKMLKKRKEDVAEDVAKIT